MYVLCQLLTKLRLKTDCKSIVGWTLKTTNSMTFCCPAAWISYKSLLAFHWKLVFLLSSSKIKGRNKETTLSIYYYVSRFNFYCKHNLHVCFALLRFGLLHFGNIGFIYFFFLIIHVYYQHPGRTLHQQKVYSWQLLTIE